MAPQGSREQASGRGGGKEYGALETTVATASAGKMSPHDVVFSQQSMNQLLSERAYLPLFDFRYHSVSYMTKNLRNRFSSPLVIICRDLEHTVMPKSAVQLCVWLIGFDESEEDEVEEFIQEQEFGISTTWEPAPEELEYQTAAFADTEENVNEIRELESTISEQYPESSISFSGLDRSRQTTMDKPIEGAYHLRVER